MSLIPPIPDVPDAWRGAAPVPLRYEDVAQDGRVMLDAFSHGLGAVVWPRLFENRAAALAMRAQGVVPILTRLVFEGGGGPVPIEHPLDGEGRFQLGHTVTADGAVDRVLLNMWLTLRGRKGRTNGPRPPDAGTPVELGRLYVEHVFTRPFGPPERRKVTRLEVPGYPDIPEARFTWRAPEAVIELPEGAHEISGMEPDMAPVVFGLAQTDSNQHVNSLMYPRLFEEAALRRFARCGRPTHALLSRFFEIAWRKPSFAGERIRVVLHAYEREGRPGATGVFVSDDDPSAKPRCYVRIEFDDG